MTYDGADGYVVLFGGFNLSSDLLYSDTWTYTGGVWNSSPTKTSPSARENLQMTYDSEDGYVLLFSGQNNNFATPPDTWTYLAGVWTNITSQLSGSPPGVAFGALVDDPYLGYPVLYGGQPSGSLFPSQTTWIFTGSGWSEMPLSEEPNSVTSFGMAIDPPNGEIVLFGGLTSTSSTTMLDGTWAYT